MPNTVPASFDLHFVKLGFIQGDGQLNRLSDERYPRHKAKSTSGKTRAYALVRRDDYSQVASVRYNEELLSLGSTRQRLKPEVPSSYDRWTDEQKRSFLRGCYSANGSVVGQQNRV